MALWCSAYLCSLRELCFLWLPSETGLPLPPRTIGSVSIYVMAGEVYPPKTNPLIDIRQSSAPTCVQFLANSRLASDTLPTIELPYNALALCPVGSTPNTAKQSQTATQSAIFRKPPLMDASNANRIYIWYGRKACNRSLLSYVGKVNRIIQPLLHNRFS